MPFQIKTKETFRKFLSRSLGDAAVFHNEAKQEGMRVAVEYIFKNTKRDTHRAAGSWTIDVGKEKTSLLLDLRERKKSFFRDKANAKHARNLSKIDSVLPQQNLTYSNDIPYIRALEFGSIRHAGDGVVSTGRVMGLHAMVRKWREISKKRRA